MRKKKLLIFLAISVLIVTATSCSKKTTMANNLPENIEQVTVNRSLYSNTNNELELSSISDWTAWINGLSIEHKVFKENETPSSQWAGGVEYLFNINKGELSFSYTDYGTFAYIYYDGEWYAVSNPTDPPIIE